MELFECKACGFRSLTFKECPDCDETPTEDMDEPTRKGTKEEV